MNSDFKTYLEKTGEMGHIVSILHFIAYVSGLPNLKPGEMVITEDGERGIVHGLQEKTAEILMFDVENLKVGKAVVRTNMPFKIPVNQNLLGRIIDPLCLPIDGLGPIRGEEELLSIEREAPGLTQRIRVNQPLETGVTIVDLLIPIGYGQRELVIGDAKTGKTSFLLQTIISQTKRGIVCVYVSIGRKISDVKLVEEYLKEEKGLEKTVIMAATPDMPGTVAYLAPYSGMRVAEYFRDLGQNVVICFDDFTTHAKIYREISLLLKRIPGRTAYPGDIFHIHAALMERAGNIKDKDGKEVSITALPVVQTLENDISGYIPTNLMAMTDGHIFFDIEEFRKGRRPAINAFLSVSRVGNQTKEPMDRNLAEWVRKKLADYYQALEVARFGVELPEKTRKTLEMGAKLEIIFNQDVRTVISREFQLFLLGLLLAGFWDETPPKIMEVTSRGILESYRMGEFSEIENKIKQVKTLERLVDLINEVAPQIKERFVWLP